MPKRNLSIRELCLISIFVAIIAVCAQISIPTAFGVPMTLQTLAITFSGLVLGAKNGTIAVLVYVLLGAVGVPVFASFSGGLGVIFGRTGGFIISFPFLAFAAGMGANKSRPLLALWLILGAAVNYVSGMLMFSFITTNGLAASFSFVVLPFVPITIIEIALVVVFGKSIKRVLVMQR